MHKILKKIIKKKQQDLMETKKADKGFINAILNSNNKKIFLIGEIKLASPSAGILGGEQEVERKVKEYEKAGINAISLVTEKNFFQGNIKMIERVKRISLLPILQKDFIIDEYQVYEAKFNKTNALLLIARILTKERLIRLTKLCQLLGIEPVIEINSTLDLQKAINTSTKIIAVNSRDLNSFKIDIQKACKLLEKIPNKFIKLAFSGIEDITQVNRYKNSGAKGILIGTSLMKSKNVGKFISSINEQFAVKVKICAVSDMKTAQAVYKSGAEFMGLIFSPTTNNHSVDYKMAKKIIQEFKNKIKIVGVFKNMPLDKVQEIIKDYQLTYAQFHGEETPAYIDKIKIKKIKTIKISQEDNIEKIKIEMRKFNVDFFLLDRVKQGKGKIINLQIAQELTKEFPIIFAGGLNPKNVKNILKEVRPFAVDVVSGVETAGKHDPKKIEKFIFNVKGAIL